MAKKKEEKKQSVTDVMKDIQGKFGKESIMKVDGTKVKKIDVSRSGSMGVDHAIGVGGYPKGRVVEIYGPESSGKTTLALHAIAEAQKDGGICAFIDAEHALDIQYAERLGVKTKDLLISQPEGGEEALQIAEALANNGQVALIVIDSVASLTPKSEIEGDIGDVKMGAQARLMSQALRMLINPIRKSNTVMIFINQIRMNIGGYGNPETTSGGKALKFYSSVRLDIRRIAQIKKGDEIMGGRVRVKIVKNKVAPPMRITEFDLMYNEGISREGELLAMGEKKGVISKNAGAIYHFNEEKLARGYDATRQYLKANPDIAKEIQKEIFKEEEEKEVVVEDKK